MLFLIMTQEHSDVVRKYSAHHDLDKFLDDVSKDVRDVKYILVGTDGKNGLRCQVREMTKKVEHLEKWKVQAMTIFVLVQMLLVPVVIALILTYVR